MEPFAHLHGRSTLLGLAGLIIVLALSGCASSEPPPFPEHPPTEIDSFGNFMPPVGHAHWLACPEGYCLAPNELTPLYAVGAQRLRDAVHAALAADPRIRIVSRANEGLRIVWIERGPHGGVATVTVDVIDADDGESGLAFYSESDGYDPTDDRARISRWLRAFQQRLVTR